MYEDVNNKIDEIIDIFNESNSIKNMINLKKELLNDETVISLLKEYEKLLVNPYDARCIEIKKKLLDNKKFNSYKNYEEQLLLLTLKINKKLECLLKEKSCVK